MKTIRNLRELRDSRPVPHSEFLVPLPSRSCGIPAGPTGLPHCGTPFWGSILLFNDKGVPISGLQNKNDKYFYFHHSEGDTMTVEDKHVLDLCLAFWTATSYVFASIDDILPR